MIIDADGHVSIPEEMFVSRLSAELRDRRPRLIVLDHDKYFWLVEGRLVPKPAGRGAGTPRGFGGPAGWQGQRQVGSGEAAPDVPKDHYLDNVAGRLEDLDKEGIQIQFIYPDLIMVDPEIADPDLACAMAQAFNDHVAERCEPAPSRLKRVAVVALQDPQEAARELRRCVNELGCLGVVIPPFVGERLLSHRGFEPFFEEANRLKTAIAVHAVTGVYSMPWQNLFTGFFGSRMVAAPLAYMVALTSLFDANMMQRYPDLKFAFIEGGCGWAPYWIRRLDEHIERHHKTHGGLASRYVSEGRIFFGCEAREYEIPHVVSELGAGCLLYSSDYPHGNSQWPNTVRVIREVKGLSEEAKKNILGLNAARFFGLESTAP